MTLTRTGRRAGVLGSLVAASALLTGCLSAGGGDTDAEGEVRLTYWDHSGNADESDTLRQILAEFEEQHEGVTVEFLSLPSDSALQKINTAISSDSTPDVSSISGSFLSPFVSQGALLDLEDYFAESSLRDELDPELVESVRGDAPDGVLHSLPFTGTSSILWYRSDWFAEAGIDAIPTWDGFFQTVAQLTDKSQGRYGFTIRGGEGSVFPLLQYAFAYTGIEDFFVDGEATVDDPAMVEAVQRYVDLYDVSTPTADLNNGYAPMVGQFDAGDIAIVQHNLGSLANHEEALPGAFAATTFPPSATGRNVVLSDPLQQYVVYEGTDHPDEAWELVEYLLSPEVNSRVNEMKSQLPTNVEARDDEWIGSIQALSAARDLQSSDDLAVVSPPLYLPEYSSIIRSDMEPVFQQVLAGQVAVADFLGQLAEKLEQAEAGFRSR
ncbi:ABC transporter substrate-binding protein [Jiangella endophytica]|uniref:ABC transporter substrate-binding protein n=1 Tax=Jiangella endophytica TaxID=1623398 RepID=UPI000E351DE6|nr:sugar ABC transporter substrate-binding protein [Jiangella endophytica]